MRKGTIGIVSAVMLALAGCANPAGQSEECDCSEAEDGGVESDAAPEAEPTQSIFGPEADVPEPEIAVGAYPTLHVVSVGFPNGGVELDAEALDALSKGVDGIRIAVDHPVVVSGHTDSGGNDEANLEASRKRGLVVADWLIENGIAKDRIQVIAFGEQNPVKPNALPDGSPDEEGRAANRRVVIKIRPKK